MEETDTRVTVKLEHIAIVVDDLAAAMAFFAELGLDLEGEATLEGDTVDRLCGLDGVHTDIAMMRTPDGHGRLELIKYHAPTGPAGDPGAAPNTPGIRHLVFAVRDIEDVLHRLRSHGAELVGELVQYENSYRLCYVRSPAGFIVELAEQLG
jgi:catechol 2,3-dioxygenase-like lactoylglutathione lyase family enzyme